MLPQVLSRASSDDLDFRQVGKLALLQALLAGQKAELDCLSVYALCPVSLLPLIFHYQLTHEQHKKQSETELPR